ncbi:GNAT family N-acetyltransferase [Streptomyces sp. NBC_01808]|uniref:GNAT family N-acetyltransferase n=1 Tax=Streptomyces sp. NBC_01808 TaxID=2975947 RepID=UPI002DD9987C|nr:GNAT family N-acetyltransferase [Streptomyces sp. NBC_01808]WSA38129.1 GNAT family N-acetyltransferase [Streptomyces sp. NBC_01808]
MEPVTLDTDRLLLRPMEAGDIDAVLAACQDPDVQRWTRVPSPYGRGHAEDFVLKVSPAGWREDTMYNFGVFTRDGGALVGSMGLVGFTPSRHAERVAELGYWTAPGQRRRGYTAEAVAAVVRWAFTEVGIDRVEWFAEVGNEPSRAVALRAGFTMEGTLRSWFVNHGTRRDAWVASLLPSDLGLVSRLPYLPAPHPSPSP